MKNDGVRHLGLLFPRYGKIKFMFQTIDQPFFGEFSLPPLITKGYVLVFSLSGWRDAISLMNYPQWKSW
jgi:hypothetical protein